MPLVRVLDSGLNALLPALLELAPPSSQSASPPGVVSAGMTSHVGCMTSLMMRAASATPGWWGRRWRRLCAPSSCSRRSPYSRISTCRQRPFDSASSLLLCPDRRAEYCDERVCLCVFVCVLWAAGYGETSTKRASQKVQRRHQEPHEMVRNQRGGPVQRLTQSHLLAYLVSQSSC